MRSTRPWIVLLLVFASGLAIGAGGMHLYTRHTIAPPPGRHGPPTAEDIARRMTELLDLGQEQQAVTLDILERHHPKAEAIMDRFHSEMDAELEAVHEELRPDRKSVV